MVRLGKVKLWKVIAISAILGICASIPVYVRMPEQCVLCRAERVEYRIAGISFPTGLKQDGEFTRWFLTHRPPHAHTWRYSAAGCMVERNFFGLILSFSMMMHHPVLFLKPTEELEFVQHQDEATLSQFFADMASTNLDLQFRAYEGARKKLADPR
ncbi:MAG TPA: hypothetical protein VNT26_02040 [Candidatus Sulfotelmatobacter sp.]|nr:hypothetical protein [Candidatus Sulfotelmatobacter sp.]